MDSARATNTNNAFIDRFQPIFLKAGWVIVLSWTFVTYLLINFLFPRWLPPDLSLYFFQPLFWLVLVAMVLFFHFLQGGRVRLVERGELVPSGALLGAIQVSVLIALGFLLGFGRSPYARDALGVLLNLWFVASRLAGVEMARWYIGKAVGKKSPALGFLFAWLVPMILLIPTGKYSQLFQAGSAFPFLGRTLLPAAAENLLAAFLAISGGPFASIAYRGVMQAFEWLSPILPDLPVMAAAFAGVLVPVLGLIALSHQEGVHTETDKGANAAPKNRGGERASTVSWLLVFTLAVGVIWLNTGSLGVQPSLVSGNSMNPAFYPGDIVITVKALPERIQVGDIIRFHRDGMDTVHRVKEIQQDGDHFVFITRGDNNNTDDRPVPESELQGKVAARLPKVGWVSIYLRTALAWIF